MGERILMRGVQEYHEEMGVELAKTEGLANFDKPKEEWKGRGRLVILAYNEGGYNSTAVDLMHIFKWIKTNMPELFKELTNF